MRKPERTRRFLIVITAILTFAAGVLAARGHIAFFFVMMAVLAAGWLAAAIAHA